jgi:FkbM family methyltransferase
LKKFKIPDANVMDIGANIGLYSLLAAKMNRSVIAVEPLHENLNRFHKAAQLENVQSRIIALVNAVSNTREEVKISILDNNVGGSYVVRPELVEKNKRFNPVSSSVIVNSILMDDLIDIYYEKMRSKVISSKGNQTLSRKFIMKLDIEGHEPFIFENSNKFFKTFQIVAIFMEFGKIVEKLDKLDLDKNPAYLIKVKNMLRMFQDLVYEPYEVNGFNKLEFKDWREWPWDIYFRKCDLVHCTSHEYKAQAVVV